MFLKLYLIHSFGNLTLHVFHSLEKTVAKLSFIRAALRLLKDSLFTMYFENIYKENDFRGGRGPW